MTPLPPMRTGFRLPPCDPEDPFVFRADFAAAGMGTLRVGSAADLAAVGRCA